MLDHDSALDLLRAHGQEHVLAFWDQLDEQGRAALAGQLARIDFDDLARLRVTLKRARHFLNCSGRRDPQSPLDAELIRGRVVADAKSSTYNRTRRVDEGQLALF